MCKGHGCSAEADTLVQGDPLFGGTSGEHRGNIRPCANASAVPSRRALWFRDYPLLGGMAALGNGSSGEWQLWGKAALGRHSNSIVL